MIPSLTITVNEHSRQITRGTSLYALRDALYPDADVLVVNGHPADSDRHLEEGDAVVLIRRGAFPAPEELESLMAARHSPGVHAILRQACVGMAGLGGLGSSIAIALARNGIGSLILADYDVVEPSNLNRQQYFVEQLGMLKTEALHETLKRIHPSIRCTLHAVKLTKDNTAALFKEVHVLAEAFDKAAEKAMLVEAALSADPPIPVVTGSGMAGYAPSNLIVTRQLSRTLICCGDGITDARPGQGLMAPRVGIVAHHQANAILRFLLGLRCDVDTQEVQTSHGTIRTDIINNPTDIRNDTE